MVAWMARGVSPSWTPRGRLAGVSPVVGSCPFEAWSWVGVVSPCRTKWHYYGRARGVPSRCDAVCWSKVVGGIGGGVPHLSPASLTCGERAVLEQRIKGVQ